MTETLVNNQTKLNGYEEKKKTAIRLLTAELDREHAAKTYGSVVIEVKLADGEVVNVRRTSDATYK